MAQRMIYQFYAELRDYEPLIWRRFQVTRSITLARLGYILMTLFEMQGGHLFDFTLPEKHNMRIYSDMRCSRYGERTAQELEAFFQREWGDIQDEDVIRFILPVPDDTDGLTDELDEDAYDATATRLSKCMDLPRQKLTFQYDFGDGWQIDVTLEEIIRDDALPGRELPRVLDGAGFGIIEDCGGPYGLAELRDALQRKSGDEYEALRQWLGPQEVHLDAFDMDDMNFRLKKLPRIFQQLYEDLLEPTALSVRILTRAYLKDKQAPAE